jgi:hypothetical protein
MAATDNVIIWIVDQFGIDCLALLQSANQKNVLNVIVRLL